MSQASQPVTEGADEPVTESTDYRGHTRMMCPVDNCRTIRTFTETVYTVRFAKTTKEARENYLRLAHKAGRHNRVS